MEEDCLLPLQDDGLAIQKFFLWQGRGGPQLSFYIPLGVYFSFFLSLCFDGGRLYNVYYGTFFKMGPLSSVEAYGGGLETVLEKIGNIENMHSSAKKFILQWLNHRPGEGANICPKYIDMTSKYLWENARDVQASIAAGRSLEEIMAALVRYNRAKGNKFIFPFPRWFGWNEMEKYFNVGAREAPKTEEEIEQIFLGWHREKKEARGTSPIGLLEEKLVRAIITHKST
jgi:hypothetical protein